MVIADDITGAAEMAGIAHRLGLKVHLYIYRGGLEGAGERAGTASDTASGAGTVDLQVYATDTRSMSEQEAVAETEQLAKQLCAAGTRPLLFKKTDSALRGHIVPELKALMHTLRIPCAVLIPQNPSMGRVVREGVYYIDDTPLHLTRFSFDPEYPAVTSEVRTRLGLRNGDNILFADADSVGQIAATVSAQADDETLFAGGADCFTAWIRDYILGTDYAEGTGNRRDETDCAEETGTTCGNTLFVCGSTIRHSLPDGVLRCNMPEALFLGAAPSTVWTAQLLPLYQQAATPLALVIDHPPQPGKAVAARLRRTMSEVVTALLRVRHPRELFIEGGATAYAILRALDWHQFDVTHELAPGIIRLRPLTPTATDLFVTMKPGSYSYTV
jgi:uncharacterized protein YgbK (DUF1537 family)